MDEDRIKELLDDVIKASAYLQECYSDCVDVDGAEKSLKDAGSAILVEIAKLRAENAAYREALSDIAHGAVGYWNLPEHHNDVIRHFMKIAADAIANKKEAD